MKKSLVAMAVMAVAGVASAQVTLYGRIDASVGSNKVESAGALAALAAEPGLNMNASANQGSRWGMTGSEDLGGGLKANFQLEGGINSDAGSAGQGGLLFGRTAKVGVSGGFGNLEMGRIVAIKDNTTWAVTGGYANYAAWGNSTDNAGLGNPNGTIAAPVRRNNAIQYTSPNMSGLSAQIMYQPGENGVGGAAPVGASSYTGLGLAYAAGPMSANLSYESSKATPGAGVASAAPAATAAGHAAAVDLTETAVSATYDFKVVKLAASYIRGAKAGAAGGDDTGYALGLSAPVGAVTVNAEYARVSTTLASGADGGKSSAINLRAIYPLSKRTNVYGLYTSGESNGAVAADTQKRTQYAAGLIHAF